MDKKINEIQITSTGSKSYQEIQIEWRIDFSLVQNTTFRWQTSPAFSFADVSEWYFVVYSNSSSFPGFMSLCLGSDGEMERDFDVEYKFGLKESDTSVRNMVLGILKAYCCESEEFKAIKLSEILSRKSDWAPRDVLTVTCTLKREISHPIQPTALDTGKPLKLIKLDTLSENFRDLFGDKETCDTTLKVQGKNYKAHRTVLIARSPVFAATFKHDTSERQTGIITIPDCDGDSFQKFLEFLYTGKLEDISCRNALHMYITSDKYDVQELKVFCVQYLIQCLAVENICDIVAFADKYEETALLSAAQDFFTKNARKIFITAEWENFMKKDNRLANKLLIEMSNVKLDN